MFINMWRFYNQNNIGRNFSNKPTTADKGRYWIHVMKYFRNDTDEVLRNPERNVTTTIVDKISRLMLSLEILIKNLEELGGINWATRLVRNILSDNLIQIDENITRSKPIVFHV